MKCLQSAPWKSPFQHHISAISPPTFALATTTTTTAISTTNPGFPTTRTPTTTCPTPTFTPRCRTMIFRGFLASIPPNHHNPLEHHNPRNVFESDAITFTTDSRMAKTGEILPPHASGGNAETKTAGGGYVEAMFWIASNTTTGENLQNQWRIRGKCYLLAEEDVDDANEVTDVLKKYLTPTGKEGAEKWSWKKEVQSHFANLTPALRGSFANPPPSVPIDIPLSQLPLGKSGGGEGLVKGRIIMDENVLDEEGPAAIARRNMRVGVVVPEVVERLDLAEDCGKARKWVYWREEGGERVNEEGVVSGWGIQEVWP